MSEANKEESGRGLKSTDFDLQFNDAQASYMDDMLGRFQARAGSKTGQNTGLIEDETILQKLSPFTKPVSLDIVSGNADKPEDLIFRLALRINGEHCYKINHNQIATVNDSVIDPPSIANNTFYFVNYEDYYYFLPHTLPTQTITTAELDYIASPENVLWGYDFDDMDRQVYRAGLSVQSKWDNNSNREIVKRMLANLGISFKDNDFVNFGKSVQMTGE